VQLGGIGMHTCGTQSFCVCVCLSALCFQEMYSSGAESSILVWSPKQKFVKPSSTKGGAQVRAYVLTCTHPVCSESRVVVSLGRSSFFCTFCSYPTKITGVMKMNEAILGRIL